MSESRQRRAVDLGEVAPARSRHAGKRSAVAMDQETIVVGTADGSVRAFDRTTLDEAWRATVDTELTGAAAEKTSVVAATVFGERYVAIGERGPAGAIRVYNRDTGDRRWRYETRSDVGTAQKETRFFLPFIAAMQAIDDRLYVAARRYERDGEARAFSSAIYAFEGDGGVRWQYDTDASPISFDVEADRVAVAFNRCTGEDQHGMVVLDADTGDVRQTWGPGTEGQRRVGDVSLGTSGIAVASHGDYRGYLLDDDGNEQWAVDLARPTDIDGERLYAYPNHVHAAADGVLFITGNTYSMDGRETESLHPNEHTAVGVSRSGDPRWRATVGGFASEIAADGTRVAVPGAQHFRTRDADVHGLRAFEVDDGPGEAIVTDGVVTAAAIDGETICVIEEPVIYHDEGDRRGDYRLQQFSLDTEN